MLFGLVVLKWITPEEMGIWNGVTIASPYISFLQLGLFVALNRELPFLIGKGDKEKAIRHVRTAATYANFISGFILIATLITLIYFYILERNQLYLFVILSFGISSASKIIQNFLTVTFRSSNDFKKLGYIYLSVIPLYFFTILLVYFYSFDGYLIYQVITPLTLVLILFFFRPYKNRPKFFIINFKDLLKTALPFFVINNFHGIAPSFRKIILIEYLGVRALGLFSPALAILLIGRMIPKIMGSYIYPKMSKMYGQSNQKRDLWEINIKSSIFSTFLSIPVVLTIYFLLPLLFEYVFPLYKDAYNATTIILFSVVLIVPQMAYNALNSVKAYKTMTVVVIFNLILYWFVTLLVFKILGGIEGVAWGILLSELTFSIIVIVAVYYELVLKPD